MKLIQLFEPGANILYSIDAAAHLTEVPRHTILVYYKHGLVTPVMDVTGAYYFDGGSIRILRRIQYLRTLCGLNLPGIKMTLDLMDEVERLRAEVRVLRR